MKKYLYILGITAALLAGALAMTGCTPDEDTPEFQYSRRLVTNVYFSPIMSVYPGQLLTVPGVGFETGDVVSFRTEDGKTEMPVSGITSKTGKITIPSAIKRSEYDIYVVRGDREQYITSVRLYLSADFDAPDKPGMNLKGVVYCGEKGLKGVRVTDGIVTTTTDNDGYYWLASEKKLGYVYITIPSGYLPEDFDNEMMGFWAPITRDVQTVENHNFGLKEVDNDNHIMLVGADLHLADKQNDLAAFRNGFIAETNAFAAAQSVPVYCMMAGDMTWDLYWYSNKFQLSDYKKLLENSCNIPVFNSMGNHDNDPYVTGDAAGEARFLTTFGPNYYSFDLGKVHYVVLDDIIWTNTGGRQGTVGNRDYVRQVSAVQMDWLEEDLAAVGDKTAPLVICLHVQLHENYNSSFSNTQKMTTTVGGTQALLDAVAGFSDVHLISGHTHHNATMRISNSVTEHNTAAVCETWWWSQYLSGRGICVDGTPSGYGLYTMSGKDVEWIYKSIGEEASYQFRTYDMNKVKTHLNTDTYKSYLAKYHSRSNGGYDYAAVGNNVVFINVWNYDPQWTISVKETGGSDLSVSRILQRDPLHTIVFDIPRVASGRDANSDWASCPNSHMFYVTTTGQNKPLEITVTDRFGNVYTEQMTLPKDFTTTMK